MRKLMELLRIDNSSECLQLLEYYLDGPMELISSMSCIEVPAEHTYQLRLPRHVLVQMNLSSAMFPKGEAAIFGDLADVSTDFGNWSMT